jgi:hypothetical protein
MDCLAARPGRAAAVHTAHRLPGVLEVVRQTAFSVHPMARGSEVLQNVAMVSALPPGGERSAPRPCEAPADPDPREPQPVDASQTDRGVGGRSRLQLGFCEQQIPWLAELQPRSDPRSKGWSPTSWLVAIDGDIGRADRDQRRRACTPHAPPRFITRRPSPVYQAIHARHRPRSQQRTPSQRRGQGLRPALKDEPTSIDHLCRLTGIWSSISRTRSQDRDGATTCGTCRARTG